MWRRRSFWLGILVVMVLLSVDLWHWYQPPTLGWLGLPFWVFYIAALHGVLIGIVWALWRAVGQQEEQQ